MGNGLETDPFKHNNVSLRAVANGKLIYSETNEYTSNTYIYAQEIKNDSNIAEELGADSLDLVEILMSLEDEFSVEIPDEEIENIKTIGDLAEYIENNQ